MSLSAGYAADCDGASPRVAMRRNLLTEWFFIEQGKIWTIYASMYYPEQEAIVPNWPPFDSNWPVAPPPK